MCFTMAISPRTAPAAQLCSIFLNLNSTMSETTAAMVIYNLSDYLSRYYNKKVIILLIFKTMVKSWFK